MLRKFSPKKRLWWHSLVVASLLITSLNACTTPPEEVDVPFETVERAEITPDTGILYEAWEPGLSVITDSGEADNLFSIQSQQMLQSADYNKFFFVAVFQGLKGSNGYGVEIENISRVKDTLRLEAQFIAPPPYSFVAEIVTSPYHLVRIYKDADWGRTIIFNLVVSETTVVSTTHHIP